MKSYDIFPLVSKVFSKTISQDIIPVKPMSSPYNIDKIKNDVFIENRRRKMNSIINGFKYNEMKLSDHPDYIKAINFIYL